MLVACFTCIVTLKMEEVVYFETFVNFCHNTRCHILENNVETLICSYNNIGVPETKDLVCNRLMH